MVLLATPVLPERPEYMEEDITEMSKRHWAKGKHGWWTTEEGKIVLPAAVADTLLSELHESAHLGEKRMMAVLQPHFVSRRLAQKVRDRVRRCPTCLKVNANQVAGPPGVGYRGLTSGEHWELDFAEIKTGMYGYKYTLVFLDTFSGWVEAYPTKKETAEVTVKSS